jgi:hypothetical protein
MASGLAVYASPGSLPSTTQDSLPVAGQALLNGLSTRKVPMKGFKAASLHSCPPFPSFLDAIDVPLGAHPFINDTLGKYERQQRGEQLSPFLDPGGWSKFLAKQETAFQKVLEEIERE